MADPFPWVTSEDGWPYPDDGDDDEGVDISNVLDDDLVAWHALPPRVLASLDPLELQVIAARFGLDGREARSMKQMHAELGHTRSELTSALGGGLEKLRIALL
jgi:DNA-directed RNA polymerase sigma subunit (sigma70/sigma32)